MHQFVRARPLGGQQLQRLRELREAGDSEVRARHLARGGGVPSDVPRAAESPVSRTVDAIVQERLQGREGVSTSARLREIVSAARRGVQTERSDRPRTTRKIAAVRRRGAAPVEAGEGRRRMRKQEAEWIEKQMQYRMRATMLEKEVRAAWQSFFAGAGTSGSSTGFVSTAEVNKAMEEMETLREQDIQKMRQQLLQLSSIASDVQDKVDNIENGEQFLVELQERIDGMEAGLEKFRLQQLKHFEEYVLEEKVLEKELDGFLEKVNEWENETQAPLGRGGGSATTIGPRLLHLNSKLSERSTAFPRRQSKNDEQNNANDKGNQSEGRTVRPGTSDELGMVDRVRRLNDAILRSGGLKGGWDSREHATFTSLLVKYGLTDDVLLLHVFPDENKVYSNQEAHTEEGAVASNSNTDYETRVAGFLRKCMRKIVTQTECSVRSHLEWYLRHLALVEEKKRVIYEWKERKEEEHQQIIQCGFDANGEEPENLNNNGTPETNRDSTSGKGSNIARAKSREKTERLLEEWKLEKKRKEEEREQRKRELQKKREAIEAKRKQEQLDAKQKVLLYKLQKEQEAMMLDRAAKLRQDSTVEDGLQIAPLPFSSPTSKEELVERSRIAIEYAKAKRLRLQQIEERKLKQQQLPPRPEAKTADENANISPKPVLVFNPTQASRARDLSKDELRKLARRRERQRAHEAYIPGEKAIPDVKVKSFGHIPIQPRAIPAWRKNI